MARAKSVDGKSIGDVYLRRIEVSHPDTVYLTKKEGSYQPTTWKQVHNQVLGLFSWYKKQGIQKGDKVCIISNSRAEWNTTDLANLSVGIITVPIYQSVLAEDAAFIIQHSDAKAIFVEDENQANKIAEALKQLGKTLPVIAFTRLKAVPSGLGVSSFEDITATPTDSNIEQEFRQLVESFQPDSVATIVYTSGTTGQPKGAVLTHSNLMNELRSVVRHFQLNHDDTTLTFLPFAHILARVESLLPLFGGTTMAFAESVNTVPANIAEVRPTLLASVPRIYEKIYTKIQSDVAQSPAIKQNIFKWATEVGREVARLRSDKKPVPLALSLKYQIADKLVFSKIRAKLGGRIRATISGGAPLSPDLCEFFHAAGIRIMEGYGLTETTAAVSVNHPDDYSFGTVGRPIPGMEFRIAEDGEILLRGPVVFKEYYKNPEATKEVFTKEGWFCTGDIGEITQRGFVKITDRKKELIVTAAGKNIAPQKIENMLKTVRYISQGLVLGDKQKYLAALLTLNEPEITKWAQAQGLSFKDYPELSQNSQVLDMIEGEIKKINQGLASYETIKRIKILPNDFTIETGELTPSLKLKRKVCQQKYRSYIEGLFV